MPKRILFNPTSIVHDRFIKIFSERFPDHLTRCVYNPRQTWFDKRDPVNPEEARYFTRNLFQTLPADTFDDVEAIVLFTCQARVPPLYLVTEAIKKNIPVIVIEEVYMFMLEQLYVNNYVLPVDLICAASDYEREMFIECGMPEDMVKTTGCVFRYRAASKKMITPDVLRRQLGVSEKDKIALLSLSLLYRGGETEEIRRSMFDILKRGLPNGYKLVVKPHPSENDKDIKKFVKEIMPEAVVVDPSIPIDDVLSISSIVFNRGNSQVIIDALQNNIPVAVIPLGRKVYFGQALNDMIVDNDKDVLRVIRAVESKGMSIYADIVKKYLDISGEKALERAVDSIYKIIRDKTLYKPMERLTAISLFWAASGYTDQAKVALKMAKRVLTGSTVADALKRLYYLCASMDDLRSLLAWSGSSYRNNLIQSLYIKQLYWCKTGLSEEGDLLLADFPSRTNRHLSMDYALMLYWLFIKSGNSKKASELKESLKEDFGTDVRYFLMNETNETKTHFYLLRTDSVKKVHWMIKRLFIR